MKPVPIYLLILSIYSEISLLEAKSNQEKYSFLDIVNRKGTERAIRGEKQERS